MFFSYFLHIQPEVLKLESLKSKQFILKKYKQISTRMNFQLPSVLEFFEYYNPDK